jgi:integrase
MLKFRHNGRQKMLRLGHFPAMSIASARAAARRLKEASAHGIDPKEQERSQTSAEAVGAHASVSEHIEAYIELYAKPNQRSWKDTAGHLRNHLGRQLGERPIGAIARSDLISVVDSMRQDGIAQGTNRMLAHTKRFFGWCVERGIIDRSPALDIRPPVKERSRDRVLTDYEIKRIWKATQEIEFPVGPAVQMLLLTGQRRDEVSRMRWNEIDLGSSVWTIPADRNKSGRPHLMPLSNLASNILQECRRSDGFVFWGRSPDTAINGWSAAKRRLDELSGIDDWRIHDLRRTAATGMARLGYDPHIVERVLNHATSHAGPLARVYQRYAYEDEKRAALDAWAHRVAELCVEADLAVSDATTKL